RDDPDELHDRVPQPSGRRPRSGHRGTRRAGTEKGVEGGPRPWQEVDHPQPLDEVPDGRAELIDETLAFLIGDGGYVDGQLFGEGEGALLVVRREHPAG